MALIVEPYPGPGLWAIRSTHYSKALRKACRTIPGMHYDEGIWWGYADAVVTTVKLLEGQGLRLQGPRPPSPAVPKDVFLPQVVAYEGLRPYQTEGVQFLLLNSLSGALLADDLGLGKSAQALRAARAVKKPTLIVCPNFAKSVWDDGPDSQVKKWWPDAWPPHVLSGVQPDKSSAINWDLPMPLVTVCHYDILHAWAPLLAGKIKFLILDEARFLQSETSRRSLAARQIAEGASRRVALDGTPVSNHTKDLWNVLDTLSPGRFGKPFAFYLRYCDAKQEKVTDTKTVWKFDGLSHEKELNERLKYMMLRRTKSDVGMQLPPRTRTILELEVEDRFSMGADVALRSDVSLRKALNLAADGKLPEVVEIVKSHLRQGRRIVVFTHRRVVCETIYGGVVDVAQGAEFLHGLVTQGKRRDRIVSRPQCLVCNMDVVAGGIDLSYYDTCIYAEIDYNPQKLIQCSGRLHRFGQKNPVLEIYTIARGTIEELIRDRDIRKLDMFEKLIGKTDDGLKADLRRDAQTSGAADLRRFWESLQTKKGK